VGSENPPEGDNNGRKQSFQALESWQALNNSKKTKSQQQNKKRRERKKEGGNCVYSRPWTVRSPKGKKVGVHVRDSKKSMEIQRDNTRKKPRKIQR